MSCWAPGPSGSSSIVLLAAAAGLAWLIRSKLPQASPHVRNWKAGVIWLLQFALAALVLILLWQPAIMVAELRPQQNIIAVLVDDSRSMSIADNGATRESQAVKALQSGVLDELQKKFQVRLYRIDGGMTRISKLDDLKTVDSRPGHAHRRRPEATGRAKRLTCPSARWCCSATGPTIPAGSIWTRFPRFAAAAFRFTPSALASSRCRTTSKSMMPSVAPRALADSRLAAKVSFHQRGYAGQKSMLTVRDGDKVLASRQITFASDGQTQNETLLFNAGAAGAKNAPVHDRSTSRRGKPRQQRRHTPGERRIQQAPHSVCGGRAPLGIQIHPPRRTGRPDRHASFRCCAPAKIKFIARALTIPKELADGFPSRVEDLFGYQATDDRIGGSKLLHAGAERTDPAICGSPRRRIAPARRARLRSGMEAGVRRALRICFRSFFPTRKEHSIAIPPRSNSLPSARTTSLRDSSKIPRATWSAGKSFPT